jgi:hypothetical protein
MIKPLPDKWIRKAIFDVVNNIVVDGEKIRCLDRRVTGSNLDNYILLTVQSNEVDKSIKCGDRWESSILIEIYTRYLLTGNTGSRLFADNITDEVRALTDTLVLDPASGLTIVTQNQSFPDDLVDTDDSYMFYRKFIRKEFLIE